MSIQLNEMSMSMGMTDVLAPLKTSEMNMPDTNAASVSPSNALPEEIAELRTQIRYDNRLLR